MAALPRRLAPRGSVAGEVRLREMVPGARRRRPRDGSSPLGVGHGCGSSRGRRSIATLLIENEVDDLPIGSRNLLEEEMATLEKAQAGSADGSGQSFQVCRR